MLRILSAAAVAVLALAVLPAPAAQAGNPSEIVVIDPGHGGKNDGAVVLGRVEKEIVLNISSVLAERMRRSKGLTPYLTRWDDSFVALSDRVLRAEGIGGKAFVSIHADNVRRVRNRGVVIFVYGANDTIPRGPAREPGEALLPPPTESARRSSLRLAEEIRLSLIKSGIKTAPYVDKGRFAVLKSGKMPSVLIEVGNLRDAKEARLLENGAFQRKFAAAVEAGVSRHFQNEARRAYTLRSRLPTATLSLFHE